MTDPQGLNLWCSGGRAVGNISEGARKSLHHVLGHNSGSWAPFEVKPSAKDAQDHDVSASSGPGAIGGHLEVVIKGQRSRKVKKGQKCT